VISSGIVWEISGRGFARGQVVVLASGPGEAAGAKMKNCLKAAMLCLALGGCATITEGTTQNIRVEVVPDTGTCILIRKDETIGASTPGQRLVNVSKSMNDILFKCSAPGHQEKEELLTSSLSTATVASFFLLDFGIVDAATGAWKKYPERLTVVLQPIASITLPAKPSRPRQPQSPITR
jgi:hypothetical protein